MINKNEYLLDEILKAVDSITDNKSDDAVLKAIDSLNAKAVEHGETLGELQDGIADVKIELSEIKTILQQIVGVVSKQTVDTVSKTPTNEINRTRKPIGAYGDTTDEL